MKLKSLIISFDIMILKHIYASFQGYNGFPCRNDFTVVFAVVPFWIPFLYLRAASSPSLRNDPYCDEKSLAAGTGRWKLVAQFL